MTREEAKNILRIITAAFPKYTPENKQDVVTLWSVMFKEEPYKVVQGAVYAYINQKHEFPPSIGQIKQIIYDMSAKANKEDISEAEAWVLVKKALRNSTYNSESEFEKLPKSVQEAIGSPVYLKSLATSEDFNDGVESSNFFRRFKQAKEQIRYEATMPDVNAMLEEQERKRLE